MVPLIWLVVGLTLLGLLATGVDLDGLMAAGLAALLLSLLSALVPMPTPVQLLLFGLAQLTVLQGLQWWSSRRRARALPWTPSVEVAEVLSGFEQGEQGRVRWQGQSWAAINLDGHQPLKRGQQVTVMGRDGTSLQIAAAPSTPATTSTD